MNKYLIFICLAIFFSSLSIISAQNETNGSVDETNITSYCGDGIIQQELSEQCDDREKNGLACSADYGEECNYCSINCEVLNSQGAFCGDGNTDIQEECDDGNTDNSDYCSNECKKTYECTFASDCDDGNSCTEDRCQESKCQRQNIDGKRIGDQYCLNGNLENQKSERVFCSENYECATNTCSEGVCVELAKEPNFIEKIINWILKFLGVRK